MQDVSQGGNGSFGLLAPAKINLFLHVTGKRDDGYHTLDSLIVFGEIGDLLTARPGKGLSLHIDGPQSQILNADAAENLIIRAARAVQAHSGSVPGVEFRLTKELPVASGIGGGSSDAASAIRLLEKIWPVRYTREERDALLVDLGADVPMCYAARPALARGIGEVLTPIDMLPDMAVVLANPGIGVATGAIFKKLAGFAPSVEGVDAADSFDGLISMLERYGNSLEAPAIECAPVIRDVITAIADLPGCGLARMSGSGATCFGLFPTQGQASAATEQLRSQYPDWWVASGRVLKEPPAIMPLSAERRTT